MSENKAVPQHAKLGLTIGTKLVTLLAMILIGSVLTLVWLSTRMFIESDTALIQQTNADNAANISIQMRELFQGFNEKVRILGTLLINSTLTSEQKTPLIREFFSKDKDLLAVFLEKDNRNGLFTLTSRAVSGEMANLGDPQGDLVIKSLFTLREFSLSSVARGEIQISSIHLTHGESAIGIAVPFLQDPADPNHFEQILFTIVRQDRFVRAFSESELITSYMINRNGTLLAHPDSELVYSNEDFSQVPIVKQLLEGHFNNGQTRFLDPKTKEYKLGAFHSVGFGGLGVVAEVLEAKAFEAAHKVEYRAGLVAWIILCISFLAGYLYSGTITWPIQQLSEAAHRISSGDFQIHLKPKGKDELAQLSWTFNEMALGLQERDRVKATFNKFHSAEIAEKLLSGEVKLGGERKTATVFFSDIRGFTSLSEALKPEDVVELLNEYMTRMVAIIRAHGGVVDKYVGDAIMALWGVPLTGKDDTYQAVRACLAMREDLAKLNEIRIARNQPALRIGIGLNAGELIAGNIGSDEKMEYTVIGDAVNLASRIESMTKEYGTDLLISNSIYADVKDRFILESAGSTRVKGKTEAVVVYKVHGYIDENGTPVVVKTPYSSYASEASDKVVHSSSEKEKPGTPVASHAHEAAPEGSPATQETPKTQETSVPPPPPKLATVTQLPPVKPPPIRKAS